jgi:hypothetical protein
VRGLHVGRVECDEMHAFIHTREKNLRPASLPSTARRGSTWPSRPRRSSS